MTYINRCIPFSIARIAASAIDYFRGKSNDERAAIKHPKIP
jgi:hypothetical protein